MLPSSIGNPHVRLLRTGLAVIIAVVGSLLGGEMVSGAVERQAANVDAVSPMQDAIAVFLGIVGLAVACLWKRRYWRRSTRVRGNVSGEQLAAMLALSGEASIVTDAAGRVTSMNLMAEELTGCSETSAIGKLLGEVYHVLDEETRKPIVNAFGDCGEAGFHQRLSGRAVLVGSDESEQPISNYASPFFDVAQNLQGTIVLFKKSVRQIRNTEALFKEGSLQRAIFESANFSIIATDASGVVQLFNVGAERMLGYSAAEVLNRLTPANISDPMELYLRAETLSFEFGTTIKPGFEALVFKASRGIEDIYELTYFRKDGSRFPAVVSVTALRDADNSIIGYLLIGTDNTARKQAEEALLKAGALQRAIFNSANFSSIATDARGVIQIFNVGAERMLGYAAIDVVNKITPAEISDPREMNARAEALSLEFGTPIKPGFEALVFKAMRGIEDIYELIYFRKDGSRFPAVVSVTALRDAKNSIIGYLLIGTDNTARKRAEIERTQAEVELKRAKVTAESANRAKSAFLAAMSHEIRTPMNGVIGTVDVLRQSSLRPYQIELVEIIQESAYSLLGIIDGILDFSKIEAGKVELERESISLGQTVETVCETLNPLAVRRGVDLTYFTDPELPERVISDSLRLRQILNNLIGNAIKFSAGQADPGRVKVRAERGEPGFARISIADNGVGMTPEVLSLLFKPFSQADSSTTRKFGGTGLGLSICKQLVALLHGTISVDSKQGEGSVFTILIPLEVAEVSGGSQEAGDLIGLDCVIVMENRETADDFRVYLEHAGARVQVAENAAEAASILEEASNSISPIVVTEACKPPDFSVLGKDSADCPNDLRHVVITRGYHRRPHRVAANLVAIDGDALRLETLLYAVALAAGRAKIVVEDESENVPSWKPPPSAADAEAEGRLILVAEDNDINQKVIWHQLALLGFACEVATDGLDALERWRSGRFALLVTDLHMPGLDGRELAARIRSEEGGHLRIPIIAFTANITKDERDRCGEAGMDDYLTKPAPLEVLKTVLNKWLLVREQRLTDSKSDLDFGEGVALSVLDTSVLAALVGSCPERIAEFLRDYRESALNANAELQSAVAAGNWAAAGSVAHRLKSSSRSVGALRLGECCARIERAGSSDAEIVGGLMGDFQCCLTSVLARIEAEEGV